MGAADAIIFALLALVDLTILIYLRSRHGRGLRTERLKRSLKIYVRRELTGEEPVRPRWQLGRAT